MKTYRYLYYNLYRIWLRKKDEWKNAQLNAVITITFLLYLNIMSIPLIIVIASNRELILLPGINLEVKIWIIAFAVGVGMLNYFLLGRKKQHNKIVEEFESVEERRKKYGFFFTIIYITISCCIPLYLFFFASV